MQPLQADMDIDMLVPNEEGITPEEREQRRNAIKKFMERKKVAQLTEQLRMRLSYASFKASRGYSALPFSKLDPLVDQEIAARSPSPSISSTMSGASLNGRTGAGGKRSRARPNSYTAGATHPYVPPTGIGLGMKHLNLSASAGAYPALDSFPRDATGLPAPGSLYMALFGSAPLGSNGFSPIKHSPSVDYSPKSSSFGSGSSGSGTGTGTRRKRTSGAAGSLPPPNSPRKHRRTTGSASFSHPPRNSSGRALQQEAEAAAILTSFLSSQESAASPIGTQSQSTKVNGSSLSRTSSTSSSGPKGGLGAPFSVSENSQPPSTPPRASTSQPAMDAAETLVYLATSPSPARPPKSSNTFSGPGRVLFPPTTPIQAHQRSQSTPNGSVNGNGTALGNQGTPFGFSFSDFVNVSPSPAQPSASAFREEGKGLAPPPGIY
ncbi:hypothetical protein DACRYDRAFT_114331 [Dacryopinax primogenitus]|uniref:Uncharacterized protein n=1 Tax=Dacryopinax primogenitus (strain DJM 731) TaxID=1858805 RepID=M5GG84_DACPD|nr:uncharacterized protein DACRYDRAFT_114331 [Dacryopinax primogenitus]EJU05043.1 hypothetical protein DACRYDRAFT_114331 [Dacryopinax primogenitus]